MRISDWSSDVCSSDLVRFEELGSNVLMFVGDDHESVATAFLDGDDVLLVDSLGSMDDARWLRRVLCGDMGKTVRVVAATHFMSDHIAGMSLFPDALTRSEEHTSELQSLMRISYAVFCLKKKKKKTAHQAKY